MWASCALLGDNSLVDSRWASDVVSCKLLPLHSPVGHPKRTPRLDLVMEKLNQKMLMPHVRLQISLIWRFPISTGRYNSGPSHFPST